LVAACRARRGLRIMPTRRPADLGTWYSKEAFPVKPIDTVGAGDGFDAGYVYSVLYGYSPEKALEFANAVGALVTTVSGDNEGLRSEEHTSELQSRENLVCRLLLE